MADARLMIHCGGREVTVDELKDVPCPKPEGKWVPVPHHTVLGYTCNALSDAGYRIDKMQLGLSRSDQRFFGTLTLTNPLASGVQLAVGVRSSLDKSISLQWCAGSRVFVCDNLAFRSEKVISRKHTTNGVMRYQEAICRAVSELADFRTAEATRIKRMQLREVSDDFALAMLMRLYQDEGILSPRNLPIALKEWREPSFEEFSETKSVWRLFNAVTFSLGQRVKTNPQAHAAATIRLSSLLSPEDAAAAAEVHQAAAV